MSKGGHGAWWWIDRWRRSSAFIDFTLAQQGAYRNLIDELWLRGGILPDDERTLGRASGDPLEWADMRDKVMAKFYRVEGGWRHETVDEVMGKSGLLHDRRADAGKKGAEAAGRGERGRFTAKDGQLTVKPTGKPTVTATDKATDKAPSSVAVAVSVAVVPEPEPEPPTIQAAGAGEPAFPHEVEARPWMNRPEPMVEGRRSELELEWLRLIREIHERTGELQEDIAPAYDGRGGLNPADLSPKRLLRDVMDLRKRRAALEPKVPPAARDTAEDELHARRHEIAAEFVAWFRLNPQAGETMGKGGYVGQAFGAWAGRKALPDSIAHEVLGLAVKLYQEPVATVDEPADPARPHRFDPDQRMRAKSDHSPLCWCTNRADHPLHGAA